MSIALCRVDDRLIHGQVVIGWGRPLGLERMVLVDDEVAANDWEHELYRMAVPDGMELVIVALAGAVASIDQWAADRVRTAVLTGCIQPMAALFRASPSAVRRINLGGLHHRPGRVERLPYLFLSDQELAALQDLAREGAVVTAQDVPTAPAVGLGALAR